MARSTNSEEQTSKEEIAANLYKYAEMGSIYEVKFLTKKIRNRCQTDIDFVIKTFDEGSGELPLHAAARNGHVAILEDIICTIGNGYDLINVRTKAGYSALHLAALHGHKHVVEWLIKSDPPSAASACNLPDEASSNTPLHLAVLHGHKHVADLLVAAGASLTLRNDKNVMPLGCCKDPGMFQTLFSLLSNDDKRIEKEMSISIAAAVGCHPCKTIMHYAALHCTDERLINKLLLKALPNPPPDNQSSIQVSTQESNHERNKLCQRFLEQLDEEGNPFLHKAGKHMLKVVQKGLIEFEHQRKFTELLIANCGFYDALILNRPLFDASITLESIMKKLKPTIANYLLYEERGEELMKQGWTTSLPTYLALYLGKHEVFHFLMDSSLGFTLNQWDAQKKRTCLHWAVIHGRVDIVERLFICSHSCCKGKNKHTQEMVSCQKRYKIPSPSIKDGAGMTAFHIAFEQKNEAVMEILRGHKKFKEYEDKLLKDREVYVQGVHAILVAAALTAGVTFAGWLQVPSQEFDNVWMKIFWGANSPAFFLAVAAMGLCVRILLPTPTIYMGQIVSELDTGIRYIASTLLCSLVAVMVAFLAAGFAALKAEGVPQPAYNRITEATAIVGATGCVATFLYYVFQVILPYFPVLPRHHRLRPRRQHPKATAYSQLNLEGNGDIWKKNMLQLNPAQT